MTDEELNRRIAEWAAIKIKRYNNDTHRHYWFGDGWYQDEPDFTHSLDALFKWAVPKLGGMVIEFFSPDGIDTDWVCRIPFWKSHYLGLEYIGETPALALARAIKSLIDQEEE